MLNEITTVAGVPVLPILRIVKLVPRHHPSPTVGKLTDSK
jgi:hypothetical protein